MQFTGFSYAVYQGDTLEVRVGLSAGGERIKFGGAELAFSVGETEYPGEISSDGKTMLFRLSGDDTSALGEGAHFAALVLKNDDFKRTFTGEVVVKNVSAPDGPTPVGGTLVLSRDFPLTRLASETLVKIDQFPAECRERLSEVESNVAANAANAAADASAAANANASATAAAATAVAAAVNAQNTSLMRYETAVCPLYYSNALGCHTRLAAVGDSFRLLYNVADCRTVALHLYAASAGTAVFAVNGTRFSLPVATAGAWAEMELESGVTGSLEVTLIAGPTDGEGATVPIVVDGVRVTCDYLPLTVGYQLRQVAARPLFYSDEVGYYHCLNSAHGEVTMLQPLAGVTAVALLAHGETAGETAVTLSVGAASVDAALSVEPTPAWQVITLPAAASGKVSLTFDSGTEAVVTDIVVYYVESEDVPTLGSSEELTTAAAAGIRLDAELGELDVELGELDAELGGLNVELSGVDAKYENTLLREVENA